MMMSKEQECKAIEAIQAVIGNETFRKLVILFRYDQREFVAHLLERRAWFVWMPESVPDPDGELLDLSPEQLLRGEIPTISREELRLKICDMLGISHK